MKLKHLLFSVLALMIAAVGCNKEGGLDGDPSIKLSQKDFSIGKNADAVTVQLTSNRDWTINMTDADKEWAHPSITEGTASAKPVTITITCDENTGRERTAKIKFTTGSATTTLTIVQEGATSTNYVSCKSLTTLANDTVIPDGTFIKVQVISNYELNNLTSTKSVYAQDVLADQKGQPGTGVQFYFASAPKVTDGEDSRNLKCGDIIELEVSGFKRSTKYDAIQLDANGKTPQPVLLTSAEDADELVPAEISIADLLDNKYQSQYVKIKESVQVAASDLTKNWADPEGKSHFSINMETADGKSFVVFNSKYSTLKNTQVAQGSGQICGIASINNGASQLIFAKADDAAGLTGERFEAQTSSLTVDQALAAGNGNALVSGRVIAACSEGVVINDGTANNLYVYNTDAKNNSFAFKIGDIVTAEGTLVTYGNVVELKAEPAKVAGSDAAIAETPAQETIAITSENITTWVPEPNGSAKVSFKGKLTISGSYINVVIDGTTVQGSVKTSGDLSAFNGKYVSCEGYWIGTTSKYFTIVETKVEEDASDRLSVSPKELSVAAAATTASFNISSTVDWKVESKSAGVTVDKTSGNGDATVTLTFAANTSDKEVVYTVEVSSSLGTEIVTLTQKAYVPAGEMAELTNEEIVNTLKETGVTKTEYGDLDFNSNSGIWKTNVCKQNTLVYLQFRNNNASYIRSPKFEKNIAKVVVSVNEKITDGRSFVAVPVDTELSTGKDDKGKNINYYDAKEYANPYGESSTTTKDKAEDLEIVFNSDTNEFMLLAKGGACYLNSIKVYFK